MTADPPPPAVFLTAEWRHLVMANYEVDPAALAPLVPPGTELDLFGGRALVSVVGFRFLGTRLLGGRVAVPGHRDFPELNLRFYVRGPGPGGPDAPRTRRGTVFVKELVPLPAVVAVARLCYGEKYVAAPLRWRFRSAPDAAGAPPDEPPAELTYSWRYAGVWNHLEVRAEPGWRASAPGSEEEFVTEHYYGYSARRPFWKPARPAGAPVPTVEYQVAHPRWQVRPVRTLTLRCPAAARLYGPALADALARPARSVFVAEGSAVTIYRGRPLGRAPLPGQP